MVQVIEEPLVLPMILLTFKTIQRQVPLYKDKSCHLLLDKSSWVGTWGKCIMMIVKMLPSILDKLFMISLLWRCFQAYLWLHIIVNAATLFAGIFQCFKSFRYKEFLDVWWWVRWCIRSINRSLLKLIVYTQILILLLPLHWSKGKVKEFSKQLHWWSQSQKLWLLTYIAQPSLVVHCSSKAMALTCFLLLRITVLSNPWLLAWCKASLIAASVAFIWWRSESVVIV